MKSISDCKVASIDYKSGVCSYHSGGKRTLRRSKLDQIVKNKEFLLLFDKESIVKLITAYKSIKKGSSNVDINTLWVTPAIKQQGWLLFLSGLYITVFISTNIFAGRFISLYGIILPGGIYGFPLTFAVLDIITEYYGFSTAKKVIWGGIKNLYIFVGLVYLFYFMGPLYISPKDHGMAKAINDALYRVFFFHDNILVITISGSIAIAVADFFNCYLMSAFKKMHKEKHLWLRCLMATFIAEAIFSMSWLTIYAFKTGYLPTSDIIYSSVSQTIIKSLYEVFMLPVTYILIFWFKYKETDHSAFIHKKL